MAYLMYKKPTDSYMEECYDAFVGFYPGKSECFLCDEIIEDNDCIYWAGGEAVIIFHRHCAASFAAHLLSDFAQSNLPEHRKIKVKKGPQP